MTLKIGIPQGLLFYQYGTVWTEFFRCLGYEAVLSGETTKATLDRGSELDEICLPAKVCYGHVCELSDRVDWLFLPRVVSLKAREYSCPKVIAMPDLVRSQRKGGPPMIDISLNQRDGWRQGLAAVIDWGRKLGKSPYRMLAAWHQAGRTAVRFSQAVEPVGPTVALIGHPYILQDRLISMNVEAKLHNCALGTITPEHVPVQLADKAAQLLGKEIYWSSGRHLAGAAMALMSADRPVDGVVFITSFACGPDALISEMIRRQAQQRHIPCMILSVDEHTAEAGFLTRVEAFADMLGRRCRPC